MAGRGTGIPLNFCCAVARRNQTFDPDIAREYGHRAGYLYPPGHDVVVRTGRTRRAPGRGNLPPRKLDTSHEYRCGCGHVGWTCHSGILHYPLVEDI